MTEIQETAAILLVDDNEDLRTSCAAFLADQGHRVLEAADALQAMRLLRSTRGQIEAVVTDVNMPGESGIRLVERIRQHQSGMPVVFISSHADERLVSRLASGDVVFLAKPFGPSSLREALATARRIAIRAESAIHNETSGARPISPARHLPRTMLALAATVVIGIGILFQQGFSKAPALPSEVPSGIVRSIRVQPLFPTGTLEDPPTTLSWIASTDAPTYRVEVRRIGYDLVWQSETQSTTIVVPKNVQRLLDAGVAFTWQVQAVVDGKVVARSERVRFRISVSHSDASNRSPRAVSKSTSEP